MDKREAVLVALTPSRGKPHSSVQVQKLLFLLDKEVCEFIDGPHFEFVPYNYGPFDKEVYRTLETLDSEGLAVIQQTNGHCTYALTPEGQETGQGILNDLDAAVQDYIRTASEFVLSLDFLPLVSAIYKAYPEMRENSIILPA